MKTIGIVGGLSAAASEAYYAAVNREVNRRLGGSHNALSLIYSFDMSDFYPLFDAGLWGEVADRLVEASRRLEAGGADFMIIACNTVHMAAPRFEGRLALPWIHIVDPTGERIRGMGLRRVGLLATRITMEGGFYAERLRGRFGVEALVPPLEDRVAVQRVISDELVFNRISEASHRALVGVIERLAAAGAEAVVLGCTELPLGVTQRDTRLPVLDGNMNHVQAAVDRALGC